MTPQEAAEEAFENYWESLGFGLRDNITDEEIMPFIEAFISGTKWQSEQDNQALSSALKEIAELHAKVNEMKDKLKQHLPEECIERYAEVKFCPIRNGDGWQCKECDND